ncbi:MAG: DUF433 domain-containing protein [Rhizonema sp. PD37]|nr:DUF433 domain-containing protein [Rhizonema sp. PD37]
MQLEDYFNFLGAEDIRLKGSRIGIETILYEYIYSARTPEEITQMFPSLTIEQVYATILYYHHEKEKVSQYITDWLEWSHKMREEQRKNPHPGVKKLIELKAAQKASQAHENSVSH